MIPSKGRMIRTDIAKSQSFAALSTESQLLFCLLIPHFNAHGKMNGEPYYVKGECVPLLPQFTPELIEKCLSEISQKTSIKWFKRDGLSYLHAVNFKDHQALKEAKMGADLLPCWTNSGEVQEKSRTTTEVLQTSISLPNSGLVQENSGVLPPEVKEEVEEEVEEKVQGLRGRGSMKGKPQNLTKPDKTPKPGILLSAKSLPAQNQETLEEPQQNQNSAIKGEPQGVKVKGVQFLTYGKCLTCKWGFVEKLEDGEFRCHDCDRDYTGNLPKPKPEVKQEPMKAEPKRLVRPKIDHSPFSKTFLDDCAKRFHGEDVVIEAMHRFIESGQQIAKPLPWFEVTCSDVERERNENKFEENWQKEKSLGIGNFDPSIIKLNVMEPVTEYQAEEEEHGAIVDAGIKRDVQLEKFEQWRQANAV